MILIAFFNLFLGILLLFAAAIVYMKKQTKPIKTIPQKEIPTPINSNNVVYSNSDLASLTDNQVTSFMEYDPNAPASQHIADNPDNCSDNTYCGPPYTRPQEICNKRVSDDNRGCTKFITFSEGSSIENNVDSLMFLQGATKVKFWKDRHYNGASKTFTCNDSTLDEFDTTCNFVDITLDPNEEYKSAKVIEDGADGYPKGVGIVRIFNNNKPDPFVFREAEHFSWYIDEAELTITNENTVDLKYLNRYVYNSDGTIDESEENWSGSNSELVKSLIEQGIDISSISLWDESISNGSKYDLSTTENAQLRVYTDTNSTMNNKDETYSRSRSINIQDKKFKKLFVFNPISSIPNDYLF